ncbi:MAG: hypothetical protein A2W90_04980 [Bacteroidetes bacterium GWF2_42_66]|nr:MAG: hypothetical protein A2W89_21200 [Bacteroidetes bacterium GWE2_42_39]OFY40839.1 MAG: hypothetical protein A2W90_04980 [Bacteroidetes bacterium GWF2_42_66]HBL75860.1 hypothetical protein [Prolixibacteraceae bacterium]HCU63109.1 hypothetical protein [Prolixibacteraceae bacterium]
MIHALVVGDKQRKISLLIGFMYIHVETVMRNSVMNVVMEEVPPALNVVPQNILITTRFILN